jgi:HlyD family secretion protein
MCNKILINYFLIILLSFLCGACSQDSSHQAQGYIEGRYTYIATPVSGVLKELAVVRGTQVTKGEKLLMLEQQPESDIHQAAIEALNQAIKAREAIKANLEYARLTYERDKILVPKHAVQQSQLDNSKAIYESMQADLAKAEAAIAAAKATLSQTDWTLHQKTLYAPVDAVVFDTYYRLGEFTEANKPIISLLAPKDIKVIFYIKEAVLPSMKLNNTVKVECDRCQKQYTARISFISPTAEYTPPVIFSTETREKLIYRIEAEFTPEDAVQLHPGQPVTVVLSP